MRVSSVLDRVAGLGSDKWRVHFRARQMMAKGESVILLTIAVLASAIWIGLADGLVDRNDKPIGKIGRAHV